MTARARVPSVSEAAWMGQVTQLARLLGYELVYHTHDSRRSTPGFPDLILARAAGPRGPARVVAIECKTQRGRVTSDQEAWLDVLQAAGVPALVARPGDLLLVHRVLQGPPDDDPPVVRAANLRLLERRAGLSELEAARRAYPDRSEGAAQQRYRTLKARPLTVLRPRKDARLSGQEEAEAVARALGVPVWWLGARELPEAAG